MEASDGPAAAVPDQPGVDRPMWHPRDALTPLETRMVAAAGTGEVLGPNGDPTDPRSTTIRAEVLRHLLVEAKGPMSDKGVQLRGLRIEGQLDLEAATLRCPLRLEDCRFESPAPVNLNYASVSLLSFRSCTVPGLSGTMLTVSKNLDLTGSTLTGPLALAGADITGNLIADSAHLHGDTHALAGETMKVGGNVSLAALTTSVGAIDLSGAEIGGMLVCTGAELQGAMKSPIGSPCSVLAEWIKVGGPLRMNGVTAAHTVWLLGARITANVNFRGSVLDGAGTALQAERVKVGGNMLAERLHTTNGGVDLRGAAIEGALQCAGANLQGALNAPDGTPCAVFAEWIKVGGPLRLNQIINVNGSVEKFTAAHTVWLLGAAVAANLNCRSATLTGATTALQAERITVGGNVLAEHLCATAGPVRGTSASIGVNLVCAEVSGNLKCTECQLSGTSWGLYGERLTVGGDVFLGSTTATGGVALPDVRIAGNLDLGEAKLNGPLRALLAHRLKVGGDLVFDGMVQQGEVSLSGAEVTGKLRWTPAEPPSAPVDLADVSVGRLEDNWALVNGGWPTDGRLCLDGLTYGSLSAAQPVRVEQRLGWIRSQWTDSSGSTTRFATQPYKQLESVYRSAGQDDDALTVAIGRRRDTREFGSLTPVNRALNRLLDTTIRYGYQTWRAVLALAIVYVIAVVVFTVAAEHAKLIVPVMQTAGGHKPPPVTKCTSTYPCFYAAGYAIDVVVPIINVRQATYWGTNGHSGLGELLTIFTWVCTVLGWLLATLALAGFTGIVRNADAT